MSTENYEFYPDVERKEYNQEKTLRLESILQEIREVVLYRADGVEINISRNPQFPPHRGKTLIERVVIETWDIAA